MKSLIILTSLFFSISLAGQERQCNCPSDTIVSKELIDCKTVTLSNGDRLYWQFDCNSIWLTLQTKFSKTTIDRIPILYAGIKHRWGYRLIKEFKTSLLFAAKCPANGPCHYKLIDRISGKLIKNFGPVVDSPREGYLFNFIVYLSKSNAVLNIYFPDLKKNIERTVNRQDFFYSDPINQFDSLQFKNKILTVAYEVSRQGTISKVKSNKFDLTKYSR